MQSFANEELYTHVNHVRINRKGQHLWCIYGSHISKQNIVGTSAVVILTEVLYLP